MLAQCYLHIALNHLDPVRSDEAWRLACELIVVDWLAQISIGQPIQPIDIILPAQTTEDIAALLSLDLVTARSNYSHLSPAGVDRFTWLVHPEVKPFTPAIRKHYSDGFANGIRNAVIKAVETAGTSARADKTRNLNSLRESQTMVCGKLSSTCSFGGDF
jgi:hypothetical protein